MKPNNFRAEQDEYRALLAQVLHSRKKIGTTQYQGWSVTSYSGHRPDPDNPKVKHIEYSAYAKTGDLRKSQKPDLSKDPSAVRVDFDDTSVVTLSATNKEELTEKLQNIFSGFHWDKEK